MFLSNQKLVPSTGFEPVTSSLPMTRSTAGAMTALLEYQLNYVFTNDKFYYYYIILLLLILDN